MAGDAATKAALAVVNEFNAFLAADDAAGLASCFFADQAWWKDQLALTYHLRTFATPNVIAAALLETKQLRGLSGCIKLEGPAQFLPASPVLQFIDCSFSFRTESPAAKCIGRIMLLPVKTGDGPLAWKIWIFNTTLEDLDIHPENQALLKEPGRVFDGSELKTDVLIIGGGNAAAVLSARLKTHGVESIMLERNPRVGDNWALRYENLAFHVPTSFCDLPYMAYDKKLASPHLLTKNDLAEQLRQYVATFNLNVMNSAKVLSTKYNRTDKLWTVKFHTPAGDSVAVAKQLVQATGIGSQKPFVPPMDDEKLYRGVSLHSTQYKSASELKAQGVKSVLVIGSANTAFDMIDNCHQAGLKTTMVVRSPTHIFPTSYVLDHRSLGLYDLGVEMADRFLLTIPSVVDSQLAKGLNNFMASQEPDRYKDLAATGFPVLDASDPGADLMSNLIERGGGHYMDVGVTELIAQGKVGVKANVEPVAFTTTGLRLSDGSTLDADAVVWCTGFADKDVRATAAEILGDSGEEEGPDILLPKDIASRLDATWGVDSEGEIRGMWKRHLEMENYWVMGGYTQQHRWHSKTLAQQIKAALEGILPPAYRETPKPEVRAA
ncbi:putative indole-3-pyruvate monooxygenase [Lachnellula suecica]|uniref:Putative indole-3-pyruvate monooxygenase n=1 Tax=Lachnellula suecica TaxID=602035 RepID=A0A8T9C1N0_9HELO|nr:putative indole-3-pyruvate monooxygenase [Lachnellula suecica]